MTNQGRARKAKGKGVLANTKQAATNRLADETDEQTEARIRGRRYFDTSTSGAAEIARVLQHNQNDVT